MTLAVLADLAQLLAETFLEPEARLQARFQQVLASDPSPALTEPLGRLVQYPQAGDAQPVEYSRLFLHARDTATVHLFESVQACGLHLAPEIMEPLQTLFGEAGLTPQEGLGVPSDHLGLEFACLSLLLGQVIEGDRAERARFRELAQRLLGGHLRPFVAAIAGQLPQAAPGVYYQAAVDLATALVAETEKALAEI